MYGRQRNYHKEKELRALNFFLLWTLMSIVHGSERGCNSCFMYATPNRYDGFLAEDNPGAKQRAGEGCHPGVVRSHGPRVQG